jgi:DMSO/TMAO reductase YedYZ molybdopterin-dependent catalytic subunit
VRSRTPTGWLVGLLTAAVAVGVGELAAAFVRPAAAPVIAVGNRIITLTPGSAKRTAIDSVGTNDKVLLIGAIYVLLAVIGAFTGELALRRLRYGLAATAAVGAFGGYCALTANGGRAGDVVPAVVATAAAMVTMTVLVRLAVRPTTGGSTGSPAGGMVSPGRRAFLQGGLATAALAAIAGFGGRAEQHHRFDVADARAKITLPPAQGPSASGPAGAARGGSPAGADLGRSAVPWATPARSFYRIDTALSVPQITPGEWRLRVHGMVDKPLTLGYDDVLARPLIDRWITLCCVSNEVGGDLIGNALFRGTLLADVLREAGVHPASDQLLLTSADGMTIGAPTRAVMDGRDALLAVGMNGEPLPVAHGFPARVVVPGLYGYVSACKWVVDIEATTFAARSAYWVDEGWAADPAIRLAARIDTPRSQKVVSVGETVSIAGVAWDQHVGVSKVEVQVDDGPWQSARLASVPSTDTWRQWLLPWTPEGSGNHRLRVRATDSMGNLQDAQVRSPFPSGATGLHTVTVRAVA